MDDVVVDTNVFVHSNNPQEETYAASRQLVEKISNCSAKLCLDEGFHTDPAKNRSKIGYEYIKHVRHGSLAFALILKLVTQQRIRILPCKVDARSKKIICQKIRKPPDRVFLSVAINSLERTLVSHDFEDFSDQKRVYLKNELNVGVITASEAVPLFP
jgi:predicted nucleic acid-binding protein